MAHNGANNAIQIPKESHGILLFGLDLVLPRLFLLPQLTGAHPPSSRFFWETVSLCRVLLAASGASLFNITSLARFPIAFPIPGMPRVDPARARRGEKNAPQQRTSSGGRLARTAPTHGAAATSFISAPRVELHAAHATDPAADTPLWRHPDELLYISEAGQTWDDTSIIRFLVANAFSIPPRPPNTPAYPWLHVVCADATEVLLPRGYRTPLLWVAKFLWTSLQLVLTAHPAIRQEEWDKAKFEILHIARLCARLLDGARKAMSEEKLNRRWRCAPFDRALHRYWRKWVIMRDELVEAFWRDFGEEEFEGDVLKLGEFTPMQYLGRDMFLTATQAGMGG